MYIFIYIDIVCGDSIGTETGINYSSDKERIRIPVAVLAPPAVIKKKKNSFFEIYIYI